MYNLGPAHYKTGVKPYTVVFRGSVFINDGINQCLPSLAAVYMVPGNFGCGSAVLAAITTLAPSLATFKAIAFPIPRLAPVMNTV